MEPFIGQIMLFAGNFAPRGWVKCDGQLLPVQDFSALFSVIGTTYGGDGRSTFAVPDLRGRAPVHEGQGPGLTPRKLGAPYGRESVTLTAAQMPAHSHGVNACTHPGKGEDPTNNFLANDKSTPYYDGPPDTTMSTDVVASAGGGQPVDVSPPSLALTFCIALEGIYPPRP